MRRRLSELGTVRSAIASLFLLISPAALTADTLYYQRVIFDNSLTPDSYYYSSGKPSQPSSLELMGTRLPVERRTFHTGPNALRLTWTSTPQGGWEAEIQAYQWRNRPMYFPGDTLSFWAYAFAEIRASDMPRLALKDTNRNFTAPLDVAKLTSGIVAKQWIQVRIPLDRFQSASVQAFDPHRVSSIFFIQGGADAVPHTLIVDDVRIDSAGRPLNVRLPAPSHVIAKGYERHIDISWDPVTTRDLDHYVIYRSVQNSAFHPIGIQVPGVHQFTDFIGLKQTATYRVSAADGSFRESGESDPASASTLQSPARDEQLLSMVQESCFRYYWEACHPIAGMARENVPGNDDIIATGASGFGVMALVAAVERGFITRQQGLDRLLQITKFLEHADRFHGAWAHFMNGATGKRMPVFDQFDNGADLVETSFLMEGLLTARQYFKGSTADEQQLSERITRLWQSVEWSWFRRTPDSPVLVWHWSPEYSWYINNRLMGWNEVMITYLLAIASPTHPVPASLYYSGWAGNAKDYLGGAPHYGVKLDVGTETGGPLFFTQYSFMGFDPHFTDRFTNYFRNNRKICIINRDYCIDNPHHFKGYGPDCWGITAVDGPRGYVPYEPTRDLDDGTIAPTGAIASFAYTPDASMQALKFFYRNLGDRLWDVFGFRDAFNLQHDWFSGIYMGLNQAPMVVMIENYRTGLIWKNFMANPEIQSMLSKVRFEPEASRANRQ